MPVYRWFKMSSILMVAIPDLPITLSANKPSLICSRSSEACLKMSPHPIFRIPTSSQIPSFVSNWRGSLRYGHLGSAAIFRLFVRGSSDFLLNSILKSIAYKFNYKIYNIQIQLQNLWNTNWIIKSIKYKFNFEIYEILRSVGSLQVVCFPPGWLNMFKSIKVRQTF